MSEPIDVFFEYPSPYSYLAAQSLPALAARHNRSLRWRPITIAKLWQAEGVLDAYGAVRRVKVGYIMHDTTRLARQAGLPFKPFRRLPDPTMARLATYALGREAPELVEPFVLATWRKLFADGADIGAMETLLEGLSPRAAAVVAKAGTHVEAAADLEAANAEALASGCFGVPWIVVNGEAYFGQDRLESIERQLIARDPA